MVGNGNMSRWEMKVCPSEAWEKQTDLSTKQAELEDFAYLLEVGCTEEEPKPTPCSSVGQWLDDGIADEAIVL